MKNILYQTLMEELKLDLNNLFNLSYNFEGLKILLTSIAKNQDLMMKKIKDLEKNSKDNKDKLESVITGKIKIKQETSNIYTNNIYEKEISEKNKDTEKSFDSKDEKDNLVIKEMERRIFNLENQYKDLKSFIPVYNKDHTLNDILDEHNVNINNINENINDINTSIGTMKEDIEQIKVKVTEFDIYDLFKDSNISGDVDVAKLLIQNLEKKVFEKLKFDEEKIKKDEEDLLKLKNDLTNLKNSSNFETRNLTYLKEQIFKIPKDIEEIRSNLSERIMKNKEYIDKIKEKFNNNIKENNANIKALKNDIQSVEERINNKINELEENLKKEKEEENKKTIEDNMVNEEFQGFKEAMIKKFNNLEKKVISLNPDIKPEQLNEKIEQIKKELQRIKPTPDEFYNLVEKVQNNGDNIENIKNENYNTQDDLKKLREFVSVINRKCESLILQNISSNKNNDDSEEYKANKDLFLSKLDDYVETTVFSEFIKEETKINEKFKKDIDSYKQFNEEIIETLKKAASIQDLKNLEDYLVDLLEEFKDKAFKYFPRKCDVNKNMKTLELQIKQIYEMILKKDERSENWMLAKKPLGGFSCASCENYLGDLKENDEKIFWNQFPEHEKEINTNRLGNGFSRILNLLNFQNENKNEKTENDNKFLKSSIEKPDYGKINNENKKEVDSENKKNEKLNFNSTLYSVNKRNKNMLRNIETNPTNSAGEANATEETNSGFNTQRLRLTSKEGLNIFKEVKEVKGKKNDNKNLPPITQRDENHTDIYEEGKGQKSMPKLMKIIKKKK